jgi:hypothetical protein
MEQIQSKARWFGQFVFYLVLFALLISAGAYFLTGQDEPARTQPAAAQASPSEMPAGQSGHDAPR